MAMPQIEKGFNVMVDGVGRAGRIKSMELPKITRKYEELALAGMEAAVDIDVGMEKMEATLVLSDVDEKILESTAKMNIGGVSLTILGSLKAENGKTEIPVVWNLKGRWKEVDLGTLEKGKIADKKYVMVVDAYKYTHNTVVKIEIDVVNNVHKANGVDLLATRNVNLGL